MAVQFVLAAGVAFGIFVGMAMQRARRAFADWRKAVATVPVLRLVFLTELRTAALLVGAALVLAALMVV